MTPKRKKRSFIKRWPVAPLLVWLVVTCVRLYPKLSRFLRVMAPATEPYFYGERNAVFAFWHGRMAVMPLFCPLDRTTRVMVSRHGDGELLSRVIKRFGFVTLRGSRSKGGSTVAAKAVKALRRGDNVAITPDGPRGPAQVAAGGVAGIARLADAPVIPVTFSAESYLRLRSWDRFMIPLPFYKILFMAGEPIFASEEETDEDFRERIERELNRITDEADAYWNAR